MARTKASVGAKVNVGKSSKARAVAPAPPPASSSNRGGGGGWTSSGGGNPACPRETPAWQLPITRFFGQADLGQASDAADGETAGTSKSRRKKNVIESDDEAETINTVVQVEPAVERGELDRSRSVLEDSVELLPLDGDSCHKIAEYFPQQHKKGTGKKSKKPEQMLQEDKENLGGRRSSKRDLDEDSGASDQKKAKIS